MNRKTSNQIAVFCLMLAFACAIAMILFSCGWQGTGTVTAKKYHRAYTQHSVSCHHTTTTTICVPESHYYPEWWELQIRDTKDSKKHWVDVDENEYKQYAVGASFTNGESK